MGGMICCIASNEGGTGKTSVACSLGAALSLQKKRVLVIDNDPQSNTTGILISKNTVVKKTLYELIDPTNTENIPIKGFSAHPPEKCNKEILLLILIP